MEAATCEKCNNPFPPGGVCRIAEYLPSINQFGTQPDSNALAQIVHDLLTYCNSADWLFPYLDNSDLDIDNGVARLIAQLEGPSKRILTHSKAALRWAAVMDIAFYGKPSKLEDILPLLEDEDALVRAGAVTALKHVNGRLEHVLPRLEDSFFAVQISAIQVLPFVGGTLEHIVPFLEAEDWTVRYIALETLPLLHGTLEHVLPRLADANAGVRRIAVEVLAKLGGRLEHLLPALEDTDEEVRGEAVKNLPRLGGTLEHLLPHLEDDDFRVFMPAIRILPELGGKIEHLRPKLHDSNFEVRWAAAEILFKVGGTLGDIMPFLTDENMHVRKTAFDQLITFVGSCEDKATLGEVVGLCERLIRESKLADIKIAARGILELIARRNIGAAMALFNSDDPELHAEGETRLKELDPSAIFIEEKAQRQPTSQDVELDD